MAGSTLRAGREHVRRLIGGIVAPQVCALTGVASRTALSAAGRTLLPQLPDTRCPRCDGPPGAELECQLCQRAAWRWIAAAALWEDPWKGLISRWKFAADHTLTPALAEVLCDVVLAEEPGPATCVVPIPPRGRSSLLRGGRIVVDLAWHVARRLDLPVALILWPEHPARPQRSLRRHARVDRRMTLQIRRELPPGTHRVLLIDDVMTTGATMAAATRALHDHWPGLDVCGAVLARSWATQQKEPATSEKIT